MSALTLKAAKEKNLRPIFRTAVGQAIDEYSDFVDIIRHVLKSTIVSMVRGRNHFKGMGEDQITYFIVSHFDSYGFHSSHDKQIGGHVDITVEFEEFLWFGEAKIHTSYLTLQKGWAQLTTRYMTGMVNEDRGAFLIYNFNKNAANVTAEWREVMIEQYPNLELGAVEDQLNFVCSGVHEGSGRKYIIDHYNIPLYFKPEDKV
ncbi:hypothetical protein [Pseudomonas syringae]|uniref:hypothetical protein n=1 Tax=Pseudomonas syringae TaxID=317 RepID=UPI000CDAA8AD|nr:hypothetical protein [Pseudomonas syringae]POP66556.1 hypothetical protein CXB35_22615 [Pseudomonas syringae]